MNDIFISYAREDRERVRPFANALNAHGWSVFWDEHIEAGDPFPQEIKDEIREAKAAIVFWSIHSCAKKWVLDEARWANDRNILVPVLLDNNIESLLPRADNLHEVQCIQLSHWDGKNISDPEFARLKNRLKGKIGITVPVASLAKPVAGEPITEEHLTLVHSSWRVKHRDSEFNDGRQYYQIHVIVFGYNAALDRIGKVIYHLDKAWPNPIQESNDRQRNFELKELANGYSIIRADVVLKDDTRQIRLSRFINLTETGPRLADEFFEEGLEKINQTSVSNP